MKKLLLLIILVLTSTFGFTQTKVADKFFDNYNYIKAIELYKDALKKESSVHILTRLGDCYYNNSNSSEAAKYYKQALNLDANDVSFKHIYKYVQTQLSLGNDDEAKTWLESLKNRQIENNTDGSEIAELIESDKLAIDKKYNITNLDLNTEYSDFGGYEHKGRMFFASTRSSDNSTGNKIYGWNEQPFLDLFETSVEEVQGVKNHGDVLSINVPNVNSDYHESTVAITNDGKTIYFTRDNLNKRNKPDSNKKGTTNLKLYKASLDNGTWKDIEELPFNSDNFSVGHPALSSNNKQLYFVSDRFPKDFKLPKQESESKGFIDTDIYVVDITDEGNTYSTPENLGTSINTNSREMFPFIAKDSTLYFSSDGYLNIGLLDIYKSDILKDSNANTQSLNEPFNSGYDDFAFYIDSETDSGYFSSDRPGGKGNDDIYSFSAYECKQMVKGVVRDKDTNEPLADATVELVNEAGKIINNITTNELGEYSFEVECEKNYSLRGSKPDFEDDVQIFTTTAVNDFKHEVDLYLDCPLCKDPCEIVINPIFFDFDKWNITTDSKVDLELIVDILTSHPDMKITIESHTDRRGTINYNDKLSDRRANSTRDYIISRGIAAERIVSATGYGERRKLISDEEIDNMSTREDKEIAHQKNRRSHFRIVDCEEDK
jgi:outer membrane protein OmpA-like peptidoglycan-associated protein